MLQELQNMVGRDETIMYEGKPDKTCFIFESIFNPMLPFALVWAAIDIGFMGLDKEFMTSFLGLFFLLHMAPVWIYLFGVFFTFRKYRNANYIVTDKGVYVSSGIFTMNLEAKTFQELSRINLHRGIFDQFFNVGDVVITTNQFGRNQTPSVISIESIENYSEVFKMVKKLQEDCYTDVMYPNDLRPDENHGYQTKYRGKL